MLQAGQLSLILTNDFERSQLVRVERTVNRSGVITATAISTNSRFRELFPEASLLQGSTSRDGRVDTLRM